MSIRISFNMSFNITCIPVCNSISISIRINREGDAVGEYFLGALFEKMSVS